MFETTVGPVKEAGPTVLPAARDGAGHLPGLQDRAAPSRGASRRSASPRSASRSATRSRPATSSSARSSSSRWRWSSSCRPTRPTSWYEHWKQARMDWYVGLGIRARPPAAARARPGRAQPLLLRHHRRRVPLPDRLAGARGHRQPRQLRPDPARPALRREDRVLRPAVGRALRPARHRAGRGRRTRDACAPLRRLRRGRDRRRAAHGAQAPPADGPGEGRRAAARAEGRPARPRPRGPATCAGGCRRSTTRAARSAGATAARTRSARRTRHDRPPVARGPHRDGPRPRHARPGPRRDRRDRRPARQRLAAPWTSPKLAAA